jgi:hypothetical protein
VCGGGHRCGDGRPRPSRPSAARPAAGGHNNSVIRYEVAAPGLALFETWESELSTTMSACAPPRGSRSPPSSHALCSRPSSLSPHLRPSPTGIACQNPDSFPQGDRWKSAGTFNPAVIVDRGKFVMLYRAQDRAGTSRLGYAESTDGGWPTFQFPRQLRLPHPWAFCAQGWEDIGLSSGLSLVVCCLVWRSALQFHRL